MWIKQYFPRKRLKKISFLYQIKWREEKDLTRKILSHLIYFHFQNNTLKDILLLYIFWCKSHDLKKFTHKITKPLNLAGWVIICFCLQNRHKKTEEYRSLRHMPLMKFNILCFCPWRKNLKIIGGRRQNYSLFSYKIFCPPPLLYLLNLKTHFYMIFDMRTKIYHLTEC